METILLIGAVPYRLDPDAVYKLERAIREGCADEEGVPLAIDEAVWACVQLANVLAEDRERGSSPEPIELGRTLVHGLCTYVLSDELVHGDAQLSALYEALLRYRAGGGSAA